MCGREIHSITMRRAGDHIFCTQCGDDIVLPVVNACANAHAESLIKMYKESGYAPTREHAEAVAEEIHDPR